ncbi:hypothetical protein FOL47_004837 [Perkinsus chesapeaki]|uniref:Uncharacterized protein n=1 Tax=Perkinsus chesapeaki TaxID=330153 RepID=A0A7J6M0E2_PERCH|nr:hypothetical protein FOL47_004837 [Perkinsus chesapeaki]
MYTPLKEFLYNGLDASKRKGHVCEEERTEHEKMEISSLRSKLASRIHALETYMATASLAAVGQRMETYDTVEAEVGGTEKAAGVDIVPVVKNKRKRRRRGCR